MEVDTINSSILTSDMTSRSSLSDAELALIATQLQDLKQELLNEVS
jgi:hypothetical protein